MEIKLLPKSYPMLSQSRIVYNLFSDQWSKLPLPQLRSVILHSSFLYLSALGMTLHYFCAVSTWNCYQMSESPDLNNNSHSCKGNQYLKSTASVHEAITVSQLLQLYSPDKLMHQTSYRISRYISHNCSKSLPRLYFFYSNLLSFSVI